jgi:hypothetical protein
MVQGGLGKAGADHNHVMVVHGSRYWYRWSCTGADAGTDGPRGEGRRWYN